MKYLQLTGLALGAAALLAGCGGGGGGDAAAPAPAAASYAFAAPKQGAHLVYAETLLDNRNNTIHRSSTDDVTAVNADGGFAMHEEDPSHNRVFSGTVDQSLYPTDYQLNAAGQAVGWTVAQPAGTIACAVTQGSVGAPATLALGAGWSTSYTETCGTGPGTAFTQTGSFAGIETITIAAGTFKAYRIVSTTTRTVAGVTRTETATRWRDASGGDTRTLKFTSQFSYSGATPPDGALVSFSRELQSAR